MRFEVQTPNGRFEITLPAETPEDQVQPMIAQALAAQQAPAPERGAGQAALNAAGQFGAGANSRLVSLAGALPNLYDRGLQAVGLPRLFGNEQQTATERLQGGLDRLIGAAPAPQGAIESLARGAGEGLVDAGTMLAPASLAARLTAPAAAAAPSLFNRVATAMAAQPGVQVAAGMTGGAVGEATDSPLLGAAASLAVPAAVGAARAISAPINPRLSPETQAILDGARRENIPLSLGQETGSRFLQNMESRFAQLPFTGATERARREAQQRAFTRAVLQRSGTEADNFTPEVIAAQRDRFRQGFTDVAGRNVMRVTPDDAAALTSLRDELLTNRVAATAQPVANQIDAFLARAADAGGELPGQYYRSLDSYLSREIRNAGGNQEFARNLGEFRSALRSIMDNSISPEDAATWQQLRRQYANFMVARDAVNGAGALAASGQIPPLQLRSALERSVGRGGYAEGRGDLNELARLGQVVRPPPDSGTAGNSMANMLLTGSLPAGGAGVGAALGGPLGAVAGTAVPFALPPLVQSMMNSPAARAWLLRQRPDVQGNALAAALQAQVPSLAHDPNTINMLTQALQVARP